MLKNVLQKTLGITPSERVLIITDSKKFRLAEKFYKASFALSKNTKIIKKPIGKRNGEEPSKHVADMMKESDVIIALTSHSLTHTDAVRRAWKNGSRIASMPGFTDDMIHALTVDPETLLKTGRTIYKYMRKTNKVHIKTPNGTDITFSIKNRNVEIDSGYLNKAGSLGNLPAGEVGVAPVEGTANGTIVIDSMEDYAKSGTIVKIRNGNAFYISDNKCKLAKIFKVVKSSKNVAEFGIGTNPNAKLIGKILVDEKIAGTCHIAFGNNINYGGKINSKFHSDAILMKPAIVFDERLVMKNGRLLLV